MQCDCTPLILLFLGLLAELVCDLQHCVGRKRVVPGFGNALGVDGFGHVAQTVEDVEGVECEAQPATQPCL